MSRVRESKSLNIATQLLDIQVFDCLRSKEQVHVCVHMCVCAYACNIHQLFFPRKKIVTLVFCLVKIL
jgi:hypothetical protein